METQIIEDANPYFKKHLPEDVTNPSKVSFIKASFFDFDFGEGQGQLSFRDKVASEILNCFNKARTKFIYTMYAYAGLVNSILYDAKLGYYKYCLIIADGVEEKKMTELQEKKQDLIYFQLEPIEHPNFKYPTMDVPRIAMAYYPKELRDKGRDFTNTLISEHTVLQYYDDLVRDSVYFFHNQSYIFYQNFTSNLDVNMASMNLKGLMIYGLQFVKEKFLVVYGDRDESDKGLGIYPCTLIKYYT